MRTQWSFSDADFGLCISFSFVELHSGKMKGEEENHFFSKSGKKKKKKLRSHRNKVPKATDVYCFVTMFD